LIICHHATATMPFEFLIKYHKSHKMLFATVVNDRPLEIASQHQNITMLLYAAVVTRLMSLRGFTIWKISWPY